MMRYIEIKITKATLFLTESELINLLARDPPLWEKAIKRGKAFRRAAAQEQREVNFNADSIKNYAGRRSNNRNCLRR